MPDFASTDLTATVDAIRTAAGAAARAPSPLKAMLNASAAFRAEFARMDCLFSAALARYEAHGSTTEQDEVMAAWATANAALFRLCADTLYASNAVLARLA